MCSGQPDPMAASDVGVSSVIHFDDSEIGFAMMAEGWEGCSSVRSRFRRHLPWLQFPLPQVHADGKQPEEKKEEDKKNPHGPSTRALELNWEVLSHMLTVYEGEFIDVHRLTMEAGVVKKCL